MFLERSIAHRHELISKVEQETARNNERQMEIQHRLHRAEQNDERYDGEKRMTHKFQLNKTRSLC